MEYQLPNGTGKLILGEQEDPKLQIVLPPHAGSRRIKFVTNDGEEICVLTLHFNSGGKTTEFVFIGSDLSVMTVHEIKNAITPKLDFELELGKE